MRTRILFPTILGSVLTMLLASGPGRTQSNAPYWPGYGGGPQHNALSPVRTQPLRTIRWTTPVDLDPPYNGNTLFIHYGSAAITRKNTVILPVRINNQDKFRIEARSGENGSLLWSQNTDYIFSIHSWIPSVGPVLTPDNRIVYPGSGGTVYIRSNPDSATGTTTQVAFYGLNNYNAAKATYDTYLKIMTPLTCDSQGTLYFGFVAKGANPLNLKSGIARITANGVGTWVSAAAASGDDAMQKVVYNCAPALTFDETTLYVAVNDVFDSGFGKGYLLALNPQTLQLKNANPASRALLKDPRNAAVQAYLADDGTASPVVSPDGDVYFGVLENPFPSNHARGFLLHFNADLTQTKTPAAFGWDISPSVFPAALVPSYHGPSPYLLMTKYNNYVEGGGDGVNKIAVLDPNVTMTDPISGVSVMKEILVAPGPTPDEEFRANHPNAVREWCVNTTVIDPFTKSALVNNEDGKCYRWDFTTNTLIEPITLTPGIGEAYTPTIAGPDGTVYFINNAKLFAVGLPNGHVTGKVKFEARFPAAPVPAVTLEFRPQDSTLTLTRTAAVDGTFDISDLPARDYVLHVRAAHYLTQNVSVNLSGGNLVVPDITLLTGDGNSDNAVNFDDFLLLADAYFTTDGVDTTYDPNADFNADGEVNFDDFLLLAGNYFLEGDE